MVTGGASGGGGLTIANAPTVTVTNPDKVSNSDAASAIAAAKNQVANASTPTNPTDAANGQQTQTSTQQTATTTNGKVPTAADAVLAVSASTPVKQVLLKNTLGSGQAL